MTELANLSRGLDFGNRASPRPVGLTNKRVVDIVLAASAIVLLAPLLILCFLANFLTSPGPVLFRHRRIGFHGKPFGCLKFRTMVPNADEYLRQHLVSNDAAREEWQSTCKLRNDPRVTAMGAILRKTSLDELPQLFNVLKGDMSIVGPRPVPEDELVKYAANIDAYHACRPGITGLWQVSGRSSTTYSKRVACDTYYSENWSMSLDIKIMLVTLPALLNSENAY